MIHSRKTLLTLAAISFLFVTAAAPTVSAEEREGITINGGLGFAMFDKNRQIRDDILLSLGAGYRFKGPWAIELGYIKADPKSDVAGVESVELDTWRLDGLYHFQADAGYISPFLSFGIGKGTFNSGVSEVDETLWNVGAGAKIALTEALSFRPELKLFRGKETRNNDIVALLGLHFSVGKVGKDYAKTDAYGTPVAQAKRAADSDNDGVSDDMDRCPDTSGAIAVDGFGCPRDTDRDGVADYLDRCPGTMDEKARINDSGCYIVLEETVRVELDVEFDVNSAATRPAHRAEVQKVVRFMEEYPDTRVTINGHTDNTGDADYNEDLSRRRAQSIANMLTGEFGIDANRVSFEGYGETRPIGSNDTDEGRQRNRRVVAIVEATVEKIETR